MSSFGVVIDTCVLYSAVLTDTLLRAATGAQPLYRLYWSADIMHELEGVMTRKLGAEKAASRVLAMRNALKGGEVTGYESLIDSMRVDAKDRHVAAAAVRAGAQVIVTLNEKDFPEAALEPLGIEVQTPDEFLCYLQGLAPQRLEAIVREQAASLGRPSMTYEDVLLRLEKQAPEFTQELRCLTEQSALDNQTTSR